MESPDWHFRKLLWVYCPEHAGVKGNDRADRMPGKTTVTRDLRLWRSEMLRSLRHYLRARAKPRNSRHRSPGRERRKKRGSARRPSLKGRERAIVSHTNIRIASKANVRESSESAYGLFRTEQQQQNTDKNRHSNINILHIDIKKQRNKTKQTNKIISESFPPLTSSRYVAVCTRKTKSLTPIIKRLVPRSTMLHNCII